MDKMTKQTQELAVKIFSLALEINSSRTRQGLTGNKPTIFVEFQGHTSQLDVGIKEKGWGFYDTSIKWFNFNYLNENPIERLEEIIEVLEKIKKEWC